MNIEIRKNMSRCYLVIEQPADIPEIEYQTRILQNCKPDGLLPFSCETVNGSQNYLYDITSRQSFQSIAESGMLEYSPLSSLLLSMKHITSVLEEYLLSPDSLVLSEECIFTDSALDSWYFCYVPGYSEDSTAQLRRLFSNLLAEISYDDRAAIMLAYNLNRYAQTDSFSFPELPSVIDNTFARLREENYQTGQDQTTLSPQNIPASERMSNQSPESFSGNIKTHSARKNGSASNGSMTFMQKIRLYLKGKNLQTVVDDINSGKIIQKIRLAEAPAAVSDVPLLSEMQASKIVDKLTDTEAARLASPAIKEPDRYTKPETDSFHRN